MSLPKWQQLGEEKMDIDEETEEIQQKFKIDKINKAFNQLSGEELFRPITKRVDEKSSATAEEEEEEQEEEQESPDYTVDEFDVINPFDYEFRPDVPTPASSPPPSPTISPPTIPSPELPLPPPPPPTPPPPYQEFDGDLPPHR